MAEWVVEVAGVNLSLIYPWALLALVIMPMLRNQPPGGTLSGAMAKRMASLPSAVSRSVRRRPPSWVFVVFATLVLALARPVTVGGIQLPTHSAHTLMLVLDISPSMAEINPRTGTSRIETAKHAIRQILQARRGDRFGLIIFADEAWQVVPPTLDGDFVAELLHVLEPSAIGGHSAIFSALDAALQALEIAAGTEGESADVILLTDGLQTRSLPSGREAMLEKAASQGIAIHALLLSQDPAGLQMLNEMTELGRSTVASSIQEIDKILAALPQQQLDSTERRGINSELYHWPLGLAIVICLLAMGREVFHRRNKGSLPWHSWFDDHLLRQYTAPLRPFPKVTATAFLTIAGCCQLVFLVPADWYDIAALKNLPLLQAQEQTQSRRAILLFDLSAEYPSEQSLSASPIQRARGQAARFLDQLPEDSRVATLAYAGDAHVITPLVDRPFLAKGALTELHPAIMPVSGDNLIAALKLAQQLSDRAAAENPLFVLYSDGGSAEHMQVAPDIISQARAQLMVVDLTDGRSAGSRMLQQLAHQSRGSYHWVSSRWLQPGPATFSGSTPNILLAFLLTLTLLTFLAFVYLQGGHLPRPTAKQATRRTPKAALAVATLALQATRRTPKAALAVATLALQAARRTPKATLVVATLALAGLIPQPSWANTPLKALHPQQLCELQDWFGDSWQGWCALQTQKNQNEAVQTLFNASDMTDRYNLGIALARVGRWEEAAGQWREVLRFQPSHWQAQHNLNVALQLLREDEQAGLEEEPVPAGELEVVDQKRKDKQIPVGSLLSQRFRWEHQHRTTGE